MARSRRYRGTPVPPLHLVLIYTCGLLTVLCGAAYFWSPPGKAETFAGALMALLGFLTGKFSNSFGKPFVPRETPDTPDTDDEQQEERRPEPPRGRAPQEGAAR